MREYIPMKVLEHFIDDDGYTERILVGFNYYKSDQRFNVAIELTEEDVADVYDHEDLESISKPQINAVARLKLKEWIDTKRPVEDDEDEGEEE